MIDSLLQDLETVIRRDPAMRGLIASEARFGRLAAGHLAKAVKSLGRPSLKIAVVTGFFVPAANPPAAETDGPIGAVRLAQALEAVGHRVRLMTDSYCFSALKVACGLMGFAEDGIFVYPETGEVPMEDEETFIEKIGMWADRLIAIERAGPSHTEESLRRQTDAPDVQERFLRLVPPECRGHCHNMRGENIDAWAGGVHRLFDWMAERRPELPTIGIGDGGNEIGMGGLAWADLERRILGPHPARIPCRIATDFTIVAGTSNWGGYALAAGILARHDRVDVMTPWSCENEEQILKRLVAGGPAVDGITRRQEATVDSLPFLTYIQAWAAMRKRLGLSH